MSKQSAETSIPSLRFSEFSGAWEEKRLGDVVSFAKGRGISKADIFQDGKTPCIRYAELYTTYGEVITNVISSTNISTMDLHLSKGGEIIIPASGERAEDIATASVVMAAGVALGGDLNILSTAENSAFIVRYFTSKLKRKLAKRAQGVSIVHLYPEHLRPIQIYIPHSDEQKKIADFLSVIDRHIEGLRAKRDALKDYKRGVMQQIFNQSLRFTQPDGSHFPDWEEKRLGDVADVYQPQTISQGNFVEQGYPVYGANGVIGCFHQYNHENAQIAVTCRGSTCGEVTLTVAKSWITGNSMVINTDDYELVMKNFLYQVLLATDFHYLVTGSGQPQITGDIKTHRLVIPHLDEQKKIANFLSTIDRRIETVSTQITETEVFKKSLLQQMFV